MGSVQEEVSALTVAQRWSEWSQLHYGDNEVDRDDSGAVESLTISQKKNKTHALLDMDERELVDPLRCAREWIRDQENSIEKNKAWTKKATIHILVVAQQEGKLESFFEKL
ncbi:hypothetical protein V6N13_122341 [Hibiscus sabdariffa]